VDRGKNSSIIHKNHKYFFFHIAEENSLFLEEAEAKNKIQKEHT